MSIAGHRRRLDRLERQGSTEEHVDLATRLEQARQRVEAAEAAEAAARALAGTDRKETPAPAPPAGVAPEPALHRPPPPPPVVRPPERRLFEDRVSRLDRNAVLTWDEAMRLGR